MIRRLMLSCFAGLFCGSLAPAQEQTLPKVTVELRAKAEKGDAMSQLFLGAAYANGSGVPTDEAEAIKWCRKAAGQGEVKGQVFLGFAYANGRGVPKDEAEAYKWYLLAGAQGDEDARKRYAILERVLTPAQREEGQQMAREFKPSKPR